MNYRLVAKYLGHFLLALGLLMIPSAGWAVYFAEWRVLKAFVGSIGLSTAAGAGLAYWGKAAGGRLFQREALGLVGVSWLVAAALGALPYVFAGVLGPVDAYFECMSGFTTTGSTVLTDIEGTYKGILFWRSFTHWLGGMGIIVLFIAVLPYLGAGGKMLFRSESPGPDPRGLRPRIQDTAFILYVLYGGFTVLETIALMLAGMDLYDALCHTFGTLATGGFSTRQASIGAFDSVAVDLIIIFFMICAGGNFALYFAVLRRKWRAPWRDTEWRVYIGLLLIGTAAVTLNLMGVQHHSAIEDSACEVSGAMRKLTPAQRSAVEEVEAVYDSEIATLEAALGSPDEPGGAEGRAEALRERLAVLRAGRAEAWTAAANTRPYASFPEALHHAAFQVVSIMTTTGYCTADSDTWPYFSRMLLMIFMFIGASAGSTGGGIKVVRVIMLVKMAYRRLEHMFRPRTIRAIRISGQVIEDDTQQTVYAFFVLYVLWFAGGALFMSLLGLPFQTAATSVAATLNNIGPGLEAVGATMDYHLVPTVGKLFLALCMALGRLELFSILVLFAPAFWRKN
ncbi:MAG TPA: hypothetical protein ENN80_01470 [Candidatus Hydrogenedentes bacterium]|nr:hypothetical protein [Candidatus Hydrogenedentota bacterium]